MNKEDKQTLINGMFKLSGFVSGVLKDKKEDNYQYQEDIIYMLKIIRNEKTKG